MVPGPILPHQCPFCEECYSNLSLRSGNSGFSTRWTDGREYFPMLSNWPEITRCRGCRRFFPPSDAIFLGKDNEEPGNTGTTASGGVGLFSPIKIVVHGVLLALLLAWHMPTWIIVTAMALAWTFLGVLKNPPAGRAGKEFRHLDADEFMELAAQTADAAKKQWLLLKAVHAHNDQYRRNLPEGFRSAPMKDPGTFRKALQSSLAYLAEDDSPGAAKLRAEFHRELGEFDEAMRMLEGVAPDHIDTWYWVIHEAIQQGKPRVLTVPPPGKRRRRRAG